MGPIGNSPDFSSVSTYQSRVQKYAPLKMLSAINIRKLQVQKPEQVRFSFCPFRKNTVVATAGKPIKSRINAYVFYEVWHQGYI